MGALLKSNAGRPSGAGSGSGRRRGQKRHPPQKERLPARQAGRRKKVHTRSPSQGGGERGGGGKKNSASQPASNAAAGAVARADGVGERLTVAISGSRWWMVTPSSVTRNRHSIPKEPVRLLPTATPSWQSWVARRRWKLLNKSNAGRPPVVAYGRMRRAQSPTTAAEVKKAQLPSPFSLLALLRR